jgi:hypothetical protein
LNAGAGTRNTRPKRWRAGGHEDCPSGQHIACHVVSGRADGRYLRLRAA